LNNLINILGVNIANSSYEEIVNVIDEIITKRKKISISYANVNVILKYNKSKELRKNLDSFSLIFSDGIGVYLTSKVLYGKKGLDFRITGTDLYYYILNFANEKNVKCFFFGGSIDAVNLLSDTLQTKFPNVQISGILPRETDFKMETIEKIRNSNADILFVGLGTPYQEEWIARYSDSINIPIQIAIGSGIEFISGAKKRAPVVFCKLGLEWLYRIYLEPKRLWKRYVFGIPIFLFKIIIFKVKLLVNKQDY
jgi:N-acetylglucosaminyldiphosphoundecaprenol N-acetyl-beta-D-mannosaminyltransferase